MSGSLRRACVQSGPSASVRPQSLAERRGPGRLQMNILSQGNFRNAITCFIIASLTVQVILLKMTFVEFICCGLFFIIMSWRHGHPLPLPKGLDKHQSAFILAWPRRSLQTSVNSGGAFQDCVPNRSGDRSPLFFFFFPLSLSDRMLSFTSCECAPPNDGNSSARHVLARRQINQDGGRGGPGGGVVM